MRWAPKKAGREAVQMSGERIVQPEEQVGGDPEGPPAGGTLLEPREEVAGGSGSPKG